MTTPIPSLPPFSPPTFDAEKPLPSPNDLRVLAAVGPVFEKLTVVFGALSVVSLTVSGAFTWLNPGAITLCAITALAALVAFAVKYSRADALQKDLTFVADATLATLIQGRGTFPADSPLPPLLPHLTHLTLDGRMFTKPRMWLPHEIDAFVNTLAQGCSQLTHLTVQYDLWTDDHIAAFKNCRTLTSLTIIAHSSTRPNTYTTTLQAETLALFKDSPLATLNLQNCQLDNVDCLAHWSKTLRELTICGIDDRDLKTLAQLRMLKTLTTLSSALTGYGFKAFQKHYKLQTIALYGCTALRPATFLRIRAIPFIQTLYIDAQSANSPYLHRKKDWKTLNTHFQNYSKKGKGVFEGSWSSR